MPPTEGVLSQALAALAPEAGVAPASVEIVGSPGYLGARLPVEDVAGACIATALLAANALDRQRGGAHARLDLDRGHVAAAVRSERFFRRGGQSSGVGFASLSRFWRTADGWVRTHANYPWHRAALLSTLHSTEDVDSVAAALAEWRAVDIEEAVCAAGGVVGAVRPLQAWRAHPQGRALADEPLIGHRVAGEAGARHRRPGALPASDVRVLDLTRVIAGPVCTRYLGALGAEVMRLDPPDHPDMAGGDVADTLLGKRSAMVDFGSKEGAAVLHGLLDKADVVVCGYRSNALDRFGLTEDALAERHPGITAVFINAWGHSGPWEGRRGFDSIVQAPTGIAMAESADGHEPGVLPCQLLDHGTGYLAAAAALDGLRRQADGGGTHVRWLSLARTAWWLTVATAAAVVPVAEGSAEPWMVELASAGGPVRAVRPPGHISGHPLAWPSPVTGYGNDPPSWAEALGVE